MNTLPKNSRFLSLKYLMTECFSQKSAAIYSTVKQVVFVLQVSFTINSFQNTDFIQLLTNKTPFDKQNSFAPKLFYQRPNFKIRVALINGKKRTKTKNRAKTLQQGFRAQ